MDSRYNRYSSSGRRSPTYNPARASMPTSVGYSSMYGGDIHVLPTTSRYDTYDMTPRGQSADYRPAAHATTRTYAITKDPISRSSSVREVSRNRRSTTLDSSQGRPIIVTTSAADRHHGSGSHTSSSLQPNSPIRESHRRVDESQYYAEPATSTRSRGNHRNSYAGQSMSATLDNDDLSRLRERQDSLLSSRVEPYSRPRPQSVYANMPRHGSINYGDDGYEYTKPSDLVLYDLDTERSPRRRRDSLDRTYHRPSVSVTTAEVPRPYESGRRGPPPTTWGLDKVNKNAAAGIYDPPSVRMPIPPSVPLAPVDPARRSGLLETPANPAERRSSSRQRPVSLYQETQPRSSHYDDYYQSRNDDMVQRELLNNQQDAYREDGVGSRGFGLRSEGKEHDDQRREVNARSQDDRRDRRESRRDYDDREPRRRSDDDVDRLRDDRREDDHRNRKATRDAGRRDEDPPRDRKTTKVKDHDRRDDDEYARKSSRESPRKEEDPRDRKAARDQEAPRKDDDGGDRKSVRDKVAAGIGIAAASIGLGPALKGKDENVDKDERASPKRRRELDEERRRTSDELDGTGSRPTERSEPKSKDIGSKQAPVLDHVEIVEPPRDRQLRKDRLDVDESDARDGKRRDPEAKAAGESQSSSSEEGRATRRPRRKRTSSAFKPTDTAGLLELKAQLAAMEENEKPAKERSTTKEPRDAPSPTDPSPERRPPPTSAKRNSPDFSDDDSRGRALAAPSREERQVRVVSPPRDLDEKKPLKGILKQPKSKFPEEDNPVREGVAPHKDDKTKQDVPTGARWTKISRRLVNPDALTIGKERFEVRDDFVIVLRVLSKEEITAYTTATAQLREMKRKDYEKEKDPDKERDDDQDRDKDDNERRRHHRHRRDRDDDDEQRDRERDRDRDRDRQERDKDRERDREHRDRDRHRHRRKHSDEDDEADSRPKAIEYNNHGHHRSFRERERERAREVLVGDI